MGRSQESFKKKEVRSKNEKKRKEKEKKRLARKEVGKKSDFDDMIAYVDENGMISSTPADPTKKKDIKKEDIEIKIPKRDPIEEPDPLRKGKVTFFNDSKGFGFIRDSETGQSIFVHVNEISENIMEDSIVQFEIVSGAKGPAAKNVRLIK
jgi:cold shock CspA family protein